MGRIDREEGDDLSGGALLVIALASLIGGALVGFLLGTPEDLDSGRAQFVAAAAALALAVYVALDAWEPYLDDDMSTKWLRKARPRMKLAVPMVAVGTALTVMLNTAYASTSSPSYRQWVAVSAAVVVVLAGVRFGWRGRR